LFFQPSLDPDRGEWNEGCDKDPEWWLQWPLLGEFGIKQRDAENTEQDTVSHPDYPYSQGFVPDVFEGHGKSKEDEVGDGLGDTDDAESTNGCAEHAGELARDDGFARNWYLVFGF
jgi:hypothetical protein